MRLDCSCTVVAGVIQYCEPHKAAFTIIADISAIVGANKSNVSPALLEKLNLLAPLLDDLQGPEECRVEVQHGRNVILYCKAHQAAYSLAGRLMDLEDGPKVGLPTSITIALTSMATAVDKVRFK